MPSSGEQLKSVKHQSDHSPYHSAQIKPTNQKGRLITGRITSSGEAHMASLVVRCGRKALSLSLSKRFFINSRGYSSAMSGLLIEEPKYAFLKDLGIGADNLGAYYGEWTASGEVRFLPVAERGSPGRTPNSTPRPNI